MAVPTCFLLFLLQAILLGLVTPPATAEQVLLPGSTLQAGQSLSFEQRGYRFTMQEDCNLVMYENDAPIWASNTGGLATGCGAFLNNDGNLVIHDRNGKQVWKSRNNVGKTYYNLVVQPDRNAVLYRQPVWSTDTSVGRVEHVPGSQSLIPPGSLRAGQHLINAQRNYKLTMKEDCDLALLDGGNPIWSTGTNGRGTGCRLVINERTGRLEIHGGTGNVLWQSTEAPPGRNHALVLQPDRNVVIYTNPTWATDTNIRMAAGLSSRAKGTETETGALDVGRKMIIDMVTGMA